MDMEPIVRAALCSGDRVARDQRLRPVVGDLSVEPIPAAWGTEVGRLVTAGHRCGGHPGTPAPHHEAGRPADRHGLGDPVRRHPIGPRP